MLQFERVKSRVHCFTQDHVQADMCLLSDCVAVLPLLQLAIHTRRQGVKRASLLLQPHPVQSFTCPTQTPFGSAR